jgi:hypothetical protein
MHVLKLILVLRSEQSGYVHLTSTISLIFLLSLYLCNEQLML